MDTVWIRTHDDVLVRAKSIMTLSIEHDALWSRPESGVNRRARVPTS